MAHKIYTKTGDQGQTSLFGGKRLSKSNLRIEAYGTVDELNSFLGLLRDSLTNAEVREEIRYAQNLLFTMGSQLATEPGKNLAIPSIEDKEVAVLEAAIDRMEKELPPLKNFILPGGHTTVSFCHVARTVCRRAERLIVALNLEEEVPDVLMQYLNRLSDYLFVLARKLGKDLGAEEVIWKPQ
jgi:cob(I)alamin adenosyltransferase